MKALALKQDILKPDWVYNFSVIVHIDNERWYHVHDNEEIEPNSKISLKAGLGLPISAHVQMIICSVRECGRTK